MDTPDSVLGFKVKFNPRTSRLAYVSAIWPFKRIYVGHRWYTLTDSQRWAVLLHEAAHCRLFHSEKRWAWRCLIFLSIFRPSKLQDLCVAQEFEADRFAAQQGYGLALIEVLIELDLVTTPSNAIIEERARSILAMHPFLYSPGLLGIPQAARIESIQKPRATMNRIFIFMEDPWYGSKGIVRDVTELTRDQLNEHYDVVLSREFENIEIEAREREWTPGQLLAAWVERVGKHHAGLALQRRRIRWLTLGAVIGLFAWPFLGAVWLWQLQDYLREVLSVGLFGSLVYWVLSVLTLLLPGLCFGAGAGWFAGCAMDSWENWKAWKSYYKSTGD